MLRMKYFETSVGRVAFSLCSGYFAEYGSCPTRQSLLVRLEQHEGATEDEFREIGETLDLLLNSSEVGNLDFLVDTTEKWCQEQASIMAFRIHFNSWWTGWTRSLGPSHRLLQGELAVSFDPHVGHDYLADYNERYDFYHLKEERISFGLEYLDKITKGGIPNKTLNVALGNTGVGKSLFMCSMAKTPSSSKGRTFSITLEMAEEPNCWTTWRTSSTSTSKTSRMCPANFWDESHRHPAEDTGSTLHKRVPNCLCTCRTLRRTSQGTTTQEVL